MFRNELNEYEIVLFRNHSKIKNKFKFYVLIILFYILISKKRTKKLRKKVENAYRVYMHIRNNNNNLQ